MLQLQVLSGQKAGDTFVARRFPVRVGRDPACDLQLVEPGVWDEHLKIRVEPGDGLVLEVQPGALTSVNGQTIERLTLRNGDVIEVAALKLRFWLGEAPQGGLRGSEWLVWLLVAATTLLEIALYLWLPR